MSEKDLDTRFSEAVEKASQMSQASLPQDVQLRLYAYYKQANYGNFNISLSNTHDLRNAFKTNAWMQISHITVEEAKESYIKTVNDILNKL